MRHCKFMYVALKSDKIKEYTDYQIARDMAPHWEDLGIQLRVKHLNSIRTTNSPVEYKFRAVLRGWLDRNTGSKKADVFNKLHDALEKIEMIRAAEEFKKAFIKRL